MEPHIFQLTALNIQHGGPGSHQSGDWTSGDGHAQACIQPNAYVGQDAAPHRSVLGRRLALAKEYPLR
jgi:hypothetical protein